jgi:hypothetical protein
VPSIPFQTLDDAVERLAALERQLTARRDRRAVFVTLYGLMTREMKRRTGEGAFRDNAWVARYAVAFANIYIDAFETFDSGGAVAKAWRMAFDTSRQGTALVSQDILLGINAHVNHDLALALDRVSIEPDRMARHADHTAVNEVLKGLSDAASERISELYARGLAGIDACAGPLDEEVSHFSLTLARENAWEAAVALANARSGLERAAVRKLLDVRSTLVARLILAPALSPTLLDACRRVEAGAWWEVMDGLHRAASAR